MVVAEGVTLHNQSDNNANRTPVSSVTTTKSHDDNNGTNVSVDQPVVSYITERGSQNGRSFGRDVYKNT